MKNKKLFIVAIIIVAVLMTFVACDLPFFINPDGDQTTVCNHYDRNHDGYCDRCHQAMPVCSVHTDSDGNGKCDACGAIITVNSDESVTVDLFSINDLHGKFLDTDSQVGVDNLTTYFKTKKAQNENTVLLSAGDMWQGSVESNSTRGAIMTDWMNYLEFAAMILGNHEFDWGTDTIASNATLANFPILAINVYSKSTNQRVSYAKNSITMEVGGIKLGIIGAIGDCYSSISSDKVSDVYFKTGSDLTNLVKAESMKLRGQGADFIVYMVHDDYSAYDIALSNGYVDIVFEGHSHQKYVNRDEKGVYHLQGGGENKGISHAQIVFNASTKKAVTINAETILSSTYRSYNADPIVNTLIQKYSAQIGDPERVVGYNKYYRDSSALCMTVAQLYYELGVSTWGGRYQIVLGGGFLKPRTPYNLSVGNVTYSMLSSLFPFDNTIQLCSIKGTDLADKFFADRDNYYTYYEQYGAYVKGSIEPTKTYYVVVDSYTSQYSWNNLTVVAEYDTTTFARDLLEQYIHAGNYAK